MTGWLGVVSADHVQIGVALGIAQIQHGRRPGLARMRAGDTFVYYSPTLTVGGRDPSRTFTALGTLADDEIFQAVDGEFHPFRRRVTFEHTRTAALADVRDQLELTDDPRWGYRLRLGLVALTDHDVEVLRDAMCG